MIKTKTNKKQLCSHKNQRIKVIATVVTCETTVIVCTECKQELTKPKTDC